MITRIRLSPSQVGAALVAVLWIIAMLSIIAASFAFAMRTETTLAHQLTTSAQARALAEGGIYRGILELFNPNKLAKWRLNGTVYAMRLGEGELRIAIQDENGRIDLNAASPELLGQLLRSVGVRDEAKLVDAILDWRDPDSLRRLQGAEDPDYQAKGLLYGPKNGAFNCVEELQQVMGMTGALYKRLAPALTVHSHQATVEARIAPREVLRALKLGTKGSRDALEPEADPDALGGVEGDERIPQPEGLTYTVRAAARIAGQTVAELSATVKLIQGAEKPYSVMVWKEDGGTLFEESMKLGSRRKN